MTDSSDTAVGMARDHSREPIPGKVILIAVLAGFSGLLCGYDSGAISGALPLPIVAAVIFLIGSLACAIFPSPVALGAARFFLGLSASIANRFGLVHLSEHSPTRPHWLISRLEFNNLKASLAQQEGGTGRVLHSALRPMIVIPILTFAQYLLNAIFSWAFPVALDAIGSIVFFIFALLSAAALWFVLARVPETSNMSLEKIEAYWRTERAAKHPQSSIQN